MKLDELKKLNEEMAVAFENFKKAKAEMETEAPEKEGEESECECEEKFKQVYASLEYLYQRIYQVQDGLLNYLYRLEDNLYKHSGTGHLPKLSASQMTKLLKSAGLDKDFEVQAPVVYAKNVALVDLTANKHEKSA